METLYSSNDPNAVFTYQKELQAIQKSPQGFAVASYLLEQQSRNCKYFGALTYAVVIQNSDLNNETLQALTGSIQGHIGQLLNDSPQISSHLFILKKLMSDLSMLYIKNPSFANPIWVFLKSMGNDQGSDILTFTASVSRLNSVQLGLLLMYFSILVEDVLKLNDHASAINSAVKKDVFPLLEVTFEYLMYLKENKQLLDDMDIQSLETLNSWMSYIPNNNGDARYDSKEIALIIKFLLQHFQQPVDGNNEQKMASFKLALQIFNEILEVNSPLLSMEQKLSLYSILFTLGEWGDQFMNQIIFSERREEFTEEVTAFVDLVLTVLQLNAIRLSKSILDASTQNILSIALRLTSIDGTPNSEEFISERMLEFWEELANVYQDSNDMFDILFQEAQDPLFRDNFELEKKTIFNEVAKVYWRKIHLPNLSIYKDIRSEFIGYRIAVAEFFIGVYALLKSDFYEMMCESLIEYIGKFSENPVLIADIEATLYLLYKINDDTVYFESQERLITPFSQKIFASNLLGTFKDTSISDDKGHLFNSTLILYIASNEFYFKTSEGNVYLGQVFDMLFPIIMANSSNLSLLASKTATKICEECSLSLTGFLANLEVIVIEMLRNSSIDSLIRLRMFNAYSVIAKNIGDVNEHAEIIKGMILTINEASQAMMSAVGSTFSESDEEYLVSLVSCLVNIGKGSSLTDEEIEQLLTEQEVNYRQFWKADPLGIKPAVLEIVTKYSLENQTLSQNTMVIEKCLQVFKMGLGESLGGPFEFDQDTIAQYLVSVMENNRNPNAVPYIFGLFESMIVTNFRNLSDELVGGLIDRLFIQRLEFLKTDPDMIKSGIDIFSKIIEYKPSLIIHLPIFVNTIIPFALEGFDANESFIIKSVLKFWITTINLKRGTKDDHEILTRLFIDLGLGKMVTFKLMPSFLRCTRSHLEYYYNVFRSLVGKFPIPFKQWLTESLEELKKTALARTDPKETNMFIHKLMITRGRRTANDVLKLFWLTANGLVEYNSQNF